VLASPTAFFFTTFSQHYAIPSHDQVLTPSHQQFNHNKSQELSAPDSGTSFSPPRKVSVDLLDMGGDSAAPVNNNSNASAGPPLYLRPSGNSSAGEFVLVPQTFQKMWTSLPDAFAGKLCTLGVTINAPADVVALMASCQVTNHKSLVILFK
jgi:hypothetical protein